MKVEKEANPSTKKRFLVMTNLIGTPELSDQELGMVNGTRALPVTDTPKCIDYMRDEWK